MSQLPFSEQLSVASEFVDIEFLDMNSEHNEKPIDKLNKKVEKLEENVNIILANQELMKRQQAEILVTLNQIVNRNSTNKSNVFPLATIDALKNLEGKIISGSSDFYINILRNILGRTGIKKGIEAIFNRNLITQLNYDGVHCKFALKECKGLLDCLFEATKNEEASYPNFIANLRLAIRLA